MVSDATSVSALSHRPARSHFTDCPTVEKSASPLFVFKTHVEAEHAIQLLSDAGTELQQMSLVGKVYYSDAHPFGFYTTGDHIKSWGGTGTFWGGIGAVLLMPAVFFLPGLGIMVMAGPAVAALVGVLESALVVEGVSALGAALIKLGLPMDQVLKYEKSLKAGKYILMVHGGAEQLLKARAALSSSGTLQAA